VGVSLSGLLPGRGWARSACSGVLLATALSAAASGAALHPQGEANRTALVPDGAPDPAQLTRTAADAADSADATDATGHAPLLREVPAASRGVDFVHHSGAPGTAKRFMIECIGAGAALFDAEGDGDLDLCFVQGGDALADGTPVPATGGDRLYLNDGSGRFTRSDALQSGSGFAFGVTAADVDGDDDADLFIAGLGPNRLLLNDGAGRLVVEPGARGMAGGDGDWSMCGAFADADGDGDLDAYVTNYLAHDLGHGMISSGRPCRWLGCEVPCGPAGLVAQQDRFYLNDGAGHFTDATHAAGLDAAAPAYAFQAVWTDLDDDGRLDVFVANDSVPNSLWRNLGPGADAEGNAVPVRFEECGLRAGCALSDTGRQQAGMGVAAGDLDGDLRIDLVMTNFSQEPNAWFHNECAPGRGMFFFEEAEAAGLGRPSYFDLGWGCSLLDVELDGDLDLFVANGHVYPQVDACGISGTTFTQDNRLYVQAPRKRFRTPPPDVVMPGAQRLSSRGSSAGDLDGDGDVDLVVTNLDGPPTLLFNESVRTGTWLRLLLAPPAAAAGARVVLEEGGRRQAREVLAGSSFLGSEDVALHFGLAAPAESGPLPSATVRWPDGLVEVFSGLRPGATVHLLRGAGQSAAKEARR
jgi:enediyne biosynthesis protein E4